MKSMKTTFLVLASFTGIATLSTSQAAEINMQTYLEKTIATQAQQVSKVLSVQLQQSLNKSMEQFFHEQGTLLHKPQYQEATTNKPINNTITVAE